jgi:hypothetical protein
VGDTLRPLDEYDISLPASVLLRDPSVVVGVPMVLAMWAVTWLEYEVQEASPRTRAIAVVLALMLAIGVALGAVALDAVPLDAWLGQTQGRTRHRFLLHGLLLPEWFGLTVVSHAETKLLLLSPGWLAAWLGEYALLVVALGVHAVLIPRTRRASSPPST